MPPIARLLLLEDQPLTAALQQKELEECGYQVTAVYNHSSALAAVEHDPPDLALIDIDLTEGAGTADDVMDGTVTAAEILQITDIPIVFLSSHSEPAIVKKTTDISSYGYLLKGCGIALLDAGIKNALELHRNRLRDRDYRRQLEQNEKRYRELFDRLRQGVVYHNSQGEIITANPSALQTLGLSLEQLQGKTPLDPCWKTIHRDGTPYPGDTHPASIVLRTGKQIAGAIMGVTQCNSEQDCTAVRWITIDAFPQFQAQQPDKLSGVIATFTDITEQINFEMELKQEKQLLQNITENMFDMVSLTDLHGNFSYISSSHGVLGYPLEQLKKKNAFDFVHPDDMEQLRNNFDRFVTHKINNIRVEYRYRCADGHYIWLETVGRLLSGDDGTVTGLLFSSRDISRRVDIDIQLQQQLNEKETLLKEVHHRVKNNLVSIINLLQLQLETTENEQTRTGLNNTIARIENLRVIYKTLLAADSYKQVSTRRYISNLLSALTALYPEHKQIMLVDRIDEFELPTNKMLAVGSIVNELVTNSVKHAFNRQKSGTVTVTLTRTGNKVTLSVTDDGKGFQSGTTAGGESGIGLTLLRLYTEQLGGEFTISGEQGTRCKVIFEQNTVKE